MKRIFLVFAAVLLASCGLTSTETRAKKEALEIAEISKTNILVVLDKMVGRGVGCQLVLAEFPNFEERWVVDSGRVGYKGCLALVSQDKVKATFRNAEEALKKGSPVVTGDWLIIERLPSALLPK
ncbi:MAG: hypothetical protein HYT94_03530 [Parcubacteria group bacterium]|nr:hypothetical protein [Parcubacteria group bacterium]